MSKCGSPGQMANCPQQFPRVRRHSMKWADRCVQNKSHCTIWMPWRKMWTMVKRDLPGGWCCTHSHPVENQDWDRFRTGHPKRRCVATGSQHWQESARQPILDVKSWFCSVLLRVLCQHPCLAFPERSSSQTSDFPRMWRCPPEDQGSFQPSQSSSQLCRSQRRHSRQLTRCQLGQIVIHPMSGSCSHVSGYSAARVPPDVLDALEEDFGPQ